MRSRPNLHASVGCRPFNVMCLIFLVVGVAACAPLVRSPDVVIGTGSPSGTYFPLGGSICRFFNLETPADSRRCVNIPSPGPIDIVDALRDGRIDIGIVQSDVLVDAVAGVGAFALRGAHPELRVLFAGHADAFTIVARRELEFHGAAELRGKRINMGSPGSGERVGMERIMAALGVRVADFLETHELTLAEQSDALCANELDAIVYEVAHPSGLIRDVVRRCRGVLVDLGGPAVDDMLSRHAEYEPAEVPGGTYLGNPDVVRTIGVRAVVVTTTKLSDVLAHQITKGVFENIDDFRRLHPAFSMLSIADMINATDRTLLHSGADRYFHERVWVR